MRDKIAAIEYVDEKVLGVLTEGLNASGEDYRLLLLPDHPTPIEVRTHTGEPVPYLLYDSTCPAKDADGGARYDEQSAARTGNHWPDGFRLIGHLLQEELC